MQVSGQIPGRVYSRRTNLRTNPRTPSPDKSQDISRQIPGHDLRNSSSREATRLILFLIYLNYTSISILQLNPFPPFSNACVSSLHSIHYSHFYSLAMSEIHTHDGKVVVPLVRSRQPSYLRPSLLFLATTRCSPSFISLTSLSWVTPALVTFLSKCRQLLFSCMSWDDVLNISLNSV